MMKNGKLIIVKECLAQTTLIMVNIVMVKKCLCIELNQIFQSTREASQKTGIAHTGIAATCRGAQKTSGGYHWEYL